MPRPTTAKPRASSQAQAAGRKGNLERDQKISSLVNEKLWVDRWAKELKEQKEWSQKWGCLNDPKLYMGENAPESFPFRNQPTKWSGFSVINPPGRQPTLTKPEIPYGFTPPTFKITGERDNQRYLQRMANNKPHDAYATSSSAYGQAYSSSKPQQQRQDSYKSRNSLQPKNSPAYYSAPFATATPVSPEEIRKVERNARATMVTYNSTLVGARGGGKAEFARDPQSVYKHPATSSQEYGWNWAGRKKLEIYSK